MDLLRRTTQSLKAVADLLLPRTCIVCERALLPDEEHLCSDCLTDMPLTRFHLLRHNPMADKFNDIIQKHLEEQWTTAISSNGCNPAEWQRETYVQPAGIPQKHANQSNCQFERYAYCTALFFYNSEAGYRHITHRIKYHADLKAGDHFGRMLGKEVASAQWLRDVDAVIPVPLHWTRKWTRGYNQAEVIARAVAKEIGVPLRDDILKRTRRTKTQTKVGVTDKEANVRDAFQARLYEGPTEVSVDTSPLRRLTHFITPHSGSTYKDDITHILLVDDVFTTGSTLGECFKALRKVFPPSVRISVATLGFVGGA